MSFVLSAVAAAILGAVALYTLQKLLGIPPFIWDRFTAKKPVEGRWFQFHFTRGDGQVLLRKEQWEVKKNFRGNLVLNGESVTLPHKRYKGSVAQRGGYWVFYLEDTGHSTTYENVIARMHDPIPLHEHKQLVGIWAGVDFDGIATAAPILLSEEDITNEDAEKILEQVHVESKYRLIWWHKGAFDPPAQ